MLKQVDWIAATDGDVCLIDREGNILLEPQIEVDALSYPSYERCQVKKDGKYGYINMQGELVIPFQFQQASPFSENGLAFVVGDDGLGGYINKNGTFVIDPIYETGSMFQFNFAAVSKNGEYKYIYNNGAQAVRSTFQYASGFSQWGLAKVVTFDGTHSLMDTMSRVVLRLKPGNELDEFKDGTRVTKFRTQDGREALINAAGDIITGFFEKVIILPYSRLHPFLRRGLWGYVNNKGEEVIPNIYKKVTPFYEDPYVKVTSYHPLAKNEEVEFYINERDEIVDYKVNDRWRDKFSYVDRFRKSVALAIKKGRKKKKIRMLAHKQRKKKATVSSTEDIITKQNPTKEHYELGLYEVKIHFYHMEKQAIIQFIKKEFSAKCHIKELDDHYVRLWILYEVENMPEYIEQAMFYAVEDRQIGEYRYTRLY